MAAVRQMNNGDLEKAKKTLHYQCVVLASVLNNFFHAWAGISSVARGGGAGGAIAPPIGLPTKMQNKENTTFLALLRLSFALD